MEATVEGMAAQLRLWGLKIDHLAAKTQVAGVQARFDALLHIDELKALHAIATSKLLEFKAMGVRPGDAREKRLKAELKSAWAELDTALHNPQPPR